MIVASRMRRPVHTVGPHDTLGYAHLLMVNRRVRHLPVVQDGRLVGILSNRDIRGALPPPTALEEARAQMEKLLTMPVSSVMTREVHTVGPTTSIEHCAMLMARHKIGCLPVLAANRLEGIITTTDVLEVLAEMLGVSTPGARLEVEVSAARGSISKVTGIIEKQGIPIASIASLPMADRARLLLVMRVRTVNTGPVIKALESAGYAIARVQAVPGAEPGRAS